jgi:Flp pilus assembly protein TadG
MADSVREYGQAVIEFALAAPFLMMFVFFLVDLCLLGYSYVSVTNAVREGARCGVVGGTNDAIVARVQATSGGLANFEDATVPLRDSHIGGDIKVQADYTYDWITPVGLVPGLSGSFQFTKSAVMRAETAAPYTKSSCP